MLPNMVICEILRAFFELAQATELHGAPQMWRFLAESTMLEIAISQFSGKNAQPLLQKSARRVVCVEPLMPPSMFLHSDQKTQIFNVWILQTVSGFFHAKLSGMESPRLKLLIYKIHFECNTKVEGCMRSFAYHPQRRGQFFHPHYIPQKYSRTTTVTSNNFLQIDVEVCGTVLSIRFFFASCTVMLTSISRSPSYVSCFLSMWLSAQCKQLGHAGWPQNRTIGSCNIERWYEGRDRCGKSQYLTVKLNPRTVPKIGRSLWLTPWCWPTTSSASHSWSRRRAALQKARSGRWNQQTKNRWKTQWLNHKDKNTDSSLPCAFGWVVPSYLVGLEEEFPVVPVVLSIFDLYI